jgi:two-component system chemotaxis response regulator CheB
MTCDEAVTGLLAHQPHVIAIGASAGAIEALSGLLPLLPAAFPVPVIVVVHVPADRPSGLVQVFAARCALTVQEAEDKCPLDRGIYVAPPDYHVLVERSRTLALSNDDALHFSRPSIDVLFDSVATSYHERGMGILMSGASVDGAAGLRHIWRAGGVTWVQAPTSAAVATMPEAALNLAPHPVLTPEEMGRALATWGRTT